MMGTYPGLGTDPRMENGTFKEQHSKSVINSDMDQETSISNRSIADEKVAGGPRPQAVPEDR